MVAPAGRRGKGSAPWGGAGLGAEELAPGFASAPPHLASGCYPHGMRWPSVLPRWEPRPSGAARGSRALKEGVQLHFEESLRGARPAGGEGAGAAVITLELRRAGLRGSRAKFLPQGSRPSGPPAPPQP